MGVQLNTTEYHGHQYSTDLTYAIEHSTAFGAVSSGLDVEAM